MIDGHKRVHRSVLLKRRRWNRVIGLFVDISCNITIQLARYDRANRYAGKLKVLLWIDSNPVIRSEMVTTTLCGQTNRGYCDQTRLLDKPRPPKYNVDGPLHCTTQLTDQTGKGHPGQESLKKPAEDIRECIFATVQALPFRFSHGRIHLSLLEYTKY